MFRERLRALRRRGVLTLLGVGAVLPALALPALSAPAAGAPVGSWRDDFSTTLDTTTWTPYPWGCKNPANVVVADGYLQLITAPSSNPKCPIEGARVDTYNKRTFGLGTYKARIRFAPAAGTWQTFWLTGAGGAAFPSNGEIDIAEVVGREPKLVHVRLHSAYVDGTTRPDGVLARCSQKIEPTVKGGVARWHTYAVKTTPGRVTFYVDGKVVAKMSPVSECTWPFADPMRMIIDAGTGEWAGPTESTHYPVTTLVDWVSWTPLKS